MLKLGAAALSRDGDGSFWNLWHQERRSRILALVDAGERATSAALAEILGVSRETVRRDLLMLEAEGRLQRVHGGAVAAETEAEAPFERRKRIAWAEKLAIGRRAAAMVAPGSVVFVDAGTTTLAFAEALAEIPRVEVVTNALGVAQRLGDRAVLLGGRIVSDVPATFGELTLAEIERFAADIAFVTPVAIHLVDGVMNYALHEAEIARAMIRRSERTAFLAIHSKLGARSRVKVCDLGGAQTIVTGMSERDGARILEAWRRQTVDGPGRDIDSAAASGLRRDERSGAT